MNSLTAILEDIHATGYVHNDLKADQVAVALLESGVDVTLLDLGYMTPIGGQPYRQNNLKSSAELDVLCEDFSWLAPEAIRGEEVSPASDVWSLGGIVNLYWELYEDNEALVDLVIRTQEIDPNSRPFLWEFRNAFDSILNGEWRVGRDTKLAKGLRDILGDVIDPPTPSTSSCDNTSPPCEQNLLHYRCEHKRLHRIAAGAQAWRCELGRLHRN